MIVFFFPRRRRIASFSRRPIASQPTAHASGEIAGASAAEGVARVDPRVPVAAGEQVALAVEADRLHFFDAETGDAIPA